MTQIKPCPFCGKETPASAFSMGNYSGQTLFYVYCSCGAGLKSAYGEGMRCLADLINRWNTRKQEDEKLAVAPHKDATDIIAHIGSALSQAKLELTITLEHLSAAQGTRDRANRVRKAKEAAEKVDGLLDKLIELLRELNSVKK